MNFLIDCLIKLYRLNQAKKVIKQALEVYSNSPEIIFRLAIINLKLGNNDLAKKYLESINGLSLNKFFENDLYSDFKNII